MKTNTAFGQSLAYLGLSVFADLSDEPEVEALLSLVFDDVFLSSVEPEESDCLLLERLSFL